MIPSKNIHVGGAFGIVHRYKEGFIAILSLRSPIKEPVFGKYLTLKKELRNVKKPNILC